MPTVTSSMIGVALPATAWLDSTYASRAIQLSVDNGTNFYTPAYDVNSTSQLAVSIMAPVTNIQFVYQAGDTWGIQGSAR